MSAHSGELTFTDKAVGDGRQIYTERFQIVRGDLVLHRNVRLLAELIGVGSVAIVFVSAALRVA